MDAKCLGFALGVCSQGALLALPAGRRDDQAVPAAGKKAHFGTLGRPQLEIIPSSLHAGRNFATKFQVGAKRQLEIWSRKCNVGQIFGPKIQVGGVLATQNAKILLRPIVAGPTPAEMAAQ